MSEEFGSFWIFLVLFVTFLDFWVRFFCLYVEFICSLLSYSHISMFPTFLFLYLYTSYFLIRVFLCSELYSVGVDAERHVGGA